jgi:hypothetical protein
MSENVPQSYATHRRTDPLYHYVLVGILGVNLLVAIVLAVRFPGFWSAWGIVLSIGLLVMAYKVRVYPLQVQDRLIRLEERLRIAAVVPEPLRSRAAELSSRQLVGLRFAPDAELPGLVEAALAEKLSENEITTGIRSWRADTFRV